MFDEHQENEINRQALFSDETQDYRYPEEPDAGETVTLRFRTAKNDVDQVFYIEEDKNIQAEMRKVSSDSLFDYYEYRMEADSQPQRYYFQVVKGSESAILTVWAQLWIFRAAMHFVLRRDFIRRSGQRARSCTRSLWTASATVTRATM